MTTISRKTYPVNPVDINSFFPDIETLPAGLHIGYRFLPPEQSCCAACVNLTELERRFHDRELRNELLALLAPQELDILRSFSRPKRIREWLGGRLAAKSAIRRLLHKSSCPDRASRARYIILPSPDYRPRVILRAGEEKPIHVSISHSGDYAVAMAHRELRCGIDLQETSHRIQKVQERFAVDDEILLLENKFNAKHDKIEYLTLLWAAKEAFKKALPDPQPPGFSGIRLMKISCRNDLSFHLEYTGTKKHQGKVMVFMNGEYVLAFTTLKPRTEFMTKNHARTPRS